jgi:RNA polymerase sigma-70 factor (ECF subfamily)
MTGGGEIQIARAIRGGAPDERDTEALRLEDADTAQLVERIKAGEQDLFTTVYARYFDRVYGYLRVMLRDSHEAEDLTQQVFVQVFEAIGGYQRRRQPFRAWLFAIVRNRAIDYLRKSKRLDVTDPADIDRRRDDHTDSGAEERIIGWISDDDLILFVERLPMAQRQVLTLRFMLGLTTTEIGDVLGREVSDVRVLQSRALRFLRDRLAAVGREPKAGRRSVGALRAGRQAWVLRRRRFALLHR